METPIEDKSLLELESEFKSLVTVKPNNPLDRIRELKEHASSLLEKEIYAIRQDFKTKRKALRQRHTAEMRELNDAEVIEIEKFVSQTFSKKSRGTLGRVATLFTTN